jgi:asparagine synthase (glutamine-hydrolysing)
VDRLPADAGRVSEALPRPAQGRRWVAAVPRDPGERPLLHMRVRPSAAPQLSAPGRACRVLFDGAIYNRNDLIAELGRHTAALGEADLLGLAYEQWGLDFTDHLRGVFAILIVDPSARRTVAIRDALGEHPLFYAVAGDALLLSTSIDALCDQAGVGRALNRAALADYLAHRWPDPHETFFASIRRVPPGHRLLASAGRVDVARYWDPAPEGAPVSWVERDELGRFDVLFEQAVARALDRGRSGIFLSGGLDSISVAAVATDRARSDGRQAPLALSIGFPGDSSEELEQRGVAHALQLDQLFLPFEEAHPIAGLLRGALEITRVSAAPILNTWMPAYTTLTRRARAAGVESIMSGAGGDEWLGVSPYIAADLMRHGSFLQLARLIGNWQRSYNLSVTRTVRTLVWDFGLRPLASRALETIAPGAWPANRASRMARSLPEWVAADQALRRELAERVYRSTPSARPRAGHYFQDVRNGLEHPLTSLELEEIYEMGRRLDVEFQHPFWDADIVDMLYRTPPTLLMTGGRAKSLVRETLGRRFPELGFERQKKRAGTSFYRTILQQSIPPLWREQARLPCLGDLGIVDGSKAAAMIENAIAPPYKENLRFVWDLLNLEAWTSAHQ